ncbi:MAG: ATP-grasp domain-containing protein [Gammaproteobacteria bacterium]
MNIRNPCPLKAMNALRLEITGTSIYQGPNVHAQQPVIHFALAQSGLGQVCQPLVEDLFRLLPRMHAHTGPCGTPGCFERDDLGPGSMLDHLFEHVCIELQNMTGSGLSCVRVDATGHTRPGAATVPYEEAAVCTEAAQLACDLIMHAASAASASTGEPSPSFNLTRRFREFLELATKQMLPVQDRVLIGRARALDIPVCRLAGRTIVLGHGAYQRRMSATKTSLTNIVGNELAANKDYSRRVLGTLGLPMPRYERVYTRRAAIDAATRVGYPVVVKPNNGSMGRGVSVRIENPRELIAAYKRARAFGRSVLVEEMIEGSDYRILVIDGKLVAAAKRVPAHVVGDGAQTIEQLVEHTNRDPRRGTGAARNWTRIKLDAQADRLLAKHDYTRQSVPRPGEVVNLRRNANTSDGGTAIDVTGSVHPDNHDIAIRAASAIGLDIAGVDIICRDISKSLWENEGRICEINSRPGIRKHLWPAEGSPRDVLTPILDMLFPPGRPRRIPVIGITGTGHRSITVHLLAHLLSVAGHHIGLAADGRVTSGGNRTGVAGISGPRAASMILLDPRVDMAVLEIRPEDVLSHGIGCDALNIVGIVNASQAAGEFVGHIPVPADIRDAVLAVARAARDVVYVGDQDTMIGNIESAGGSARVCRLSVDAVGRTVAEDGPDAGERVVLDGDSLMVHGKDPARVRIAMGPLLDKYPDVDPADAIQAGLYAVLAALALGLQADFISRTLPGFRAAAPNAPIAEDPAPGKPRQNVVLAGNGDATASRDFTPVQRNDLQGLT